MKGINVIIQDSWRLFKNLSWNACVERDKYFLQSKLMNSGTETIRSTSSSPHQRERPTNSITQPQIEQMASRVGSLFPKRWQLCYPNLTEKYINELRNRYNQIHIKFSTSKGRKNKYNKTTTNRTDDKQSWQPFPKKVATLLPKLNWKVNKWTQVLIQSDPHQVHNIKGKDSKYNQTAKKKNKRKKKKTDDI